VLFSEDRCKFYRNIHSNGATEIQKVLSRDAGVHMLSTLKQALGEAGAWCMDSAKEGLPSSVGTFAFDKYVVWLNKEG
jgi:hypothetical protein